MTTIVWANQFNNRWLLGPTDLISPVEFEQAYYSLQRGTAIGAVLN